MALRFALELAALAALGYWGFAAGEGAWGWLLGLGAPLVAAALWGAFRTPGDDAHGRPPPVAVPGALRLGLELAFFGAAVWGLAAAGRAAWALALGALVAFHYLLAYDRVARLLRR